MVHCEMLECQSLTTCSAIVLFSLHFIGQLLKVCWLFFPSFPLSRSPSKICRLDRTKYQNSFRLAYVFKMELAIAAISCGGHRRGLMKVTFVDYFPTPLLLHKKKAIE